MRADGNQGGNRNEVRIRALERTERAPHRRAGADGVVDDCDTSSSEVAVKREGNAVIDRIEAGTATHDSLGKAKAGTQLERDHLREEGAPCQRPANHLRSEPGQLLRQGSGKGTHLPWMQKEPVKVEPDVGVIAGLEAEVASAKAGKG